MYKKAFCAVLCLLALCCALTACGAPETPPDAPEKAKIVTTIFPLYDWTRQILGDRADGVELTMLLDNGADLHSYQPTVEDMARLADCDLFIYVGGESDEWVGDALKGVSNQNRRVLNLMDALGGALREEELLPGMTPEEEDEEETAYDEHIWLSLKNASACCSSIADTLETMGVITRQESGVDEYCAGLAALDARYQETLDAAPLKTVLFADRFPFRYLADDYGLDACAAFQGCSAETEASFETIAFLAAKLDELQLPAVLTTESADDRIAETVIRTSGRPDTPVLSLDSMQSVTAAEASSGAAYLSIMESNLDVLRRALGGE
ncbi:MAG: zinc ABC transporter substrate-binding protein [Oscillibacter sp.]|nr:zinc ABC transporter substrate-binding protein [Oscillibacter sp.]